MKANKTMVYTTMHIELPQNYGVQVDLNAVLVKHKVIVQSYAGLLPAASHVL